MTERRTTLHVEALIASAGLGGFFFDDQAAIRSGAERDGATYRGNAVTPGYSSVREPAESVSVMLVLSDGYVAVGDCVSVQYSGVGGREPRFHAAHLVEVLQEELAPLLRGFDVSNFRAAALAAESLIAGIDGLGRSAAYGVSQALLDAAAHAAGHHLMARVVRDEWNLSEPWATVPIYSQSGEERYENVDKMILKNVPVLPHGLINTPTLVGVGGEALEAYVLWIRKRLAELSANADYLPTLHLDVYGQIGVQAEGSVEGTADIIQRLERAAGPHGLRIEHPIDAGSRGGQIETLGALRRLLAERGSRVEIVADEWANTAEDIHLFVEAGAVDLVQIKTPDLGSIHHTVDAILDCQAHGVGTVLGGSCSETDRSAIVTANIGVATGATQMLAKPGMGVDEGLAIVSNEMNRILRLDRHLDDVRSRA
ncbi:methylaspartate ammonia-lyase [Homoserinimonas sp. OAct 916]|uniref:methylaspartate ammonia-lyase n=1 Tax=Homoserinimonas sp. OAct 916 TaxID=2211450 RepID=UPI000DBE4DCA|nr:methylaspartate ammonia-lyase [Homoserinimonas sp. OAct 916]